MLPKRLETSSSDLGEEHDGHPLRRVPHSLTSHQSKVEAARQHKQRNENRPDHRFDGEAIFELRLDRWGRLRCAFCGEQVVARRHAIFLFAANPLSSFSTSNYVDTG